MCTVTYIPTGNDSFLLTSNRDEAPGRASLDLRLIEQNGKQLLFPKDKGGKGSWITVADSNQMVCLLNGAFIKHKHRPPYKHSRGLVVLGFFDYPDAESFFRDFDFSGLEPFTLVIYDNGDLWEFRWDEVEKHVKRLDAMEKYIWSSCTLYDETMHQKRESWFADWLDQQSGFTMEGIRNFHLTAGDGDPRNDVVMNRDGKVQTVSVTNIVKTIDLFEMHFKDLLNNEDRQTKLPIRSQTPLPKPQTVDRRPKYI